MWIERAWKGKALFSWFFFVVVSVVVGGLFYTFNVTVILNVQCEIQQFNKLKHFLLAICVIYKLGNRKHSDH